MRKTLDQRAISEEKAGVKPKLEFQKDKFWPFDRGASFVWAIGSLLVMVVALAILRSTLGWPGDEGQNVAFLGIAGFALLPILLTVADAYMDRRRAREVALNLEELERFTSIRVETALPANLGVGGRIVERHETGAVLGALGTACGAEAVLVDLEAGQAWTESRFLGLVAAASRVGRPSRVVFLATEGGAPRRFVGWADPRDLLNATLRVDPEYRVAFHQAQAAARQWSLLEPAAQGVPKSASECRATYVTGEVAQRYDFSELTVLDRSQEFPDRFLAERILIGELGDRVDRIAAPRFLTVTRVEELFRSTLFTDAIDTSWGKERCATSFVQATATAIAILGNGAYQTLIERSRLLEGMRSED